MQPISCNQESRVGGKWGTEKGFCAHRILHSTRFSNKQSKNDPGPGTGSYFPAIRSMVLKLPFKESLHFHLLSSLQKRVSVYPLTPSPKCEHLAYC